MNDDYKHILLLEFNMSFTHDPKALCTPYFSHRVFKEIIYWKTTCRWSNGLGLIKGECYNICVQSPPWGATVSPQGTHPLGRHLFACIYKHCLPCNKDNCHLLLLSNLVTIVLQQPSPGGWSGSRQWHVDGATYVRHLLA
jgi:hypothetical protein